MSLHQFTCPRCGAAGAGDPHYYPHCHGQDCEARLLPSQNGKILPVEEWPRPEGPWLGDLIEQGLSVLTQEQLDWVIQFAPPQWVARQRFPTSMTSEAILKRLNAIVKQQRHSPHFFVVKLQDLHIGVFGTLMPDDEPDTFRFHVNNADESFVVARIISADVRDISEEKTFEKHTGAQLVITITLV